MTDVGNLPFRQAAHYHPGRIDAVRLIGIHSMECDQGPGRAEQLQTMEADPNGAEASVHAGFDLDSAVRDVHDDDTSYGAPQANAIAIHIEHAGWARWSREQWLATSNGSMLQRSAHFAALEAVQFRLPAVELNPDQARNGGHGFATHHTLTIAFGIQGGHTDPGDGWPMDVYLRMVRDAMHPGPATVHNPHHVPMGSVDCRPGATGPGDPLGWVEWALRMPETGKGSTELANIVAAASKRRGEQPDGVVRPGTNLFRYLASVTR